MALADLPITATTAAAGAIAAIVLYAAWAAFVNYTTSPFSSTVPGPLLAKLTPKWVFWVDMAGARGATIKALHEKHGPVVQLAPNELSFSGVEAMKRIYNVGTTCRKADIYVSFGRRGIFQMLDPDEHKQRLKRIAHCFTNTSINKVEPLMQRVTSDVVQALEKRVDQEVDALFWMRMVALDISGEVLLGKSFGCFEGDGKAPDYVHHLDNTYIVFSLYNMSPLLCFLLRLLPIQALQNFFRAPDVMYGYGNAAMEEYIHRFGRDSEQRSLLTRMLKGDAEAGVEPLSDTEISIETSNLVFAATDTSGNTMTYALYQLCLHPEWQEKLRKELRDSGLNTKGFPFKDVQNLPILHAVMMETLRVNPAAPSSLPRVTTGKGIDVDGLHVPGGVLVSMQALTTQNDARFFPRPSEWDPSRWLNADGTVNPGTPEQREMMMSWGKGTRTCLGQYMATMDVKLTLAKVVERFAFKVAGEKTHDEMVMTDHFTLIPKGQRCGLVFSEVA